MSSPNYALRHLGQDNASYSSECVEEKFSEVRGSKVGQPLPYLGLSGRGAYALALYSRTSWNRYSRKFISKILHIPAPTPRYHPLRATRIAPPRHRL
jgi:hypothetical protein